MPWGAGGGITTEGPIGRGIEASIIGIMGLGPVPMGPVGPVGGGRVVPPIGGARPMGRGIVLGIGMPVLGIGARLLPPIGNPGAGARPGIAICGCIPGRPGCGNVPGRRSARTNSIKLSNSSNFRLFTYVTAK